MSTRIRAAIALTGFSLITACVVAEAGLRLIDFSRPNFYMPDAVLGARLRPGVQGWDRREGEGWVSINSGGLRDQEHTLRRAPNTLRIAVLGDSFAEALQVDVSETFWAVAETQLADCAALNGKTVEFINFGVSGYGTAQEYLMLKHEAADYAPDIVVLQFFARNDVRDNHAALTPDTARPFFTLLGDALRLDASFRSRPRHQRRTSTLAQTGYAVINHVRLLQLINAALNEIRKPARSTGPATSQIADPIFAKPTSRQWIEAWRVTERLLETTAREAVSQGAEFVLMSASLPGQVHPDPSQRRAFAAARGVDDLFYSEHRLTQLAMQAGFNFLPLGPKLQAEADDSGVFFHGFERSETLGQGHWNRDGHHRAGAHLANHLCKVVTSTTPQIARF